MKKKKAMMTMSSKKKLLKDIMKICEGTEKEVSKMKKETSLEKPVENDVVLSLRNQGYNEIKDLIEKYQNESEE